MTVAPVTVVETPTFLSAAKKLMGDAERSDLVSYLASNPTAGDLIEGSGGARKLRWSRPGMGKRGGSRVVYFYHSPSVPLFLFTVYAKNAKDNLNDAEKSELRQIIGGIGEAYRDRSR